MRGHRNVAPGISVGSATLNSYTDYTANSLLAIDQQVVEILSNYEAFPATPVAISTLDIGTDLAGRTPNLVKITVQGSKLDVLRAGAFLGSVTMSRRRLCSLNLPLQHDPIRTKHFCMNCLVSWHRHITGCGPSTGQSPQERVICILATCASYPTSPMNAFEQ